MNKSMFSIRTVIITFLLIIGSAAACQASMVTATSDASGGFMLSGQDLKDMTSIVISIGYEAEVLSNPVLSPQGFISQRAQLSVVNKQPGSLSFSISRENSPFSGSGGLVNLKFSKIADLPGNLTYLNASYTDREGNQNAVETAIFNPAAKVESETGKESGGKGGENAAEQPQPKDNDIETTQAAAAADNVVATAGDGSRGGQESRSQSYRKEQSVLERFRDYSGKRDLSALRALFDRKDTLGIIQEPAIALSDGKTPVTVTVRAEPPGSGVPLFALKGAELTSLKMADAASLVLQLIPARGKYEVILTVSTDAAVIEYPLAIAPVLADFLAVKTGDLPEYLLDYVTTANKIVSPASDR